MQVRWAPMGTTLGTCRNGHGCKLECDIVRARATYGTQTGQECKRRQEGVDNMQAQMLNGCADGGHGLTGLRSQSIIGKTSAKSCDHLQQIYTIDYISKSFIYYGGKLRLHT
jgi:hypothetical protein